MTASKQAASSKFETLASRARRAAKDPAGTLQKVRDRVTDGSARPGRAPAEPVVYLPPAQALHDNGFAVFRGWWTPEECARLAAQFKSEAGIAGKTFTKADAVNTFDTARSVLFDPRMLGAVRAALGQQPKFLQVSDLHYRYDSQGWHRDSVHRAKDASTAPDWADPAHPYGVVKAILYMEAENAALGMIAGTHRSPIEIDLDAVKAVEDAGGQLVISPGEEPNRKLDTAQRTRPVIWQASPGDLLVFDERLYHAGRRVDGGVVSTNRDAPKFVTSMVFGADNHHSERMYSYFRFARRDLHYQPLQPALADELAARDLVPGRNWGNIYEDEPQSLRNVWLRRPHELEGLIEEFAKAGSSA